MKEPMIFLCGVGVGVVGCLIYIKKKLIPDLTEEIKLKLSEEELEPVDISDVEDINDYMDDDEDDEYVVTDPKVKQKLVKAQNTDYSKYAKAFEKKVKEESTDEDAKELTEVGGTDPYVIDESQYDEHSNYQAHAYEVYSDGIVFDIDAEEILDADPDIVFGKTAMEALSESPDGVVHVRDDSKKRDYRLERTDYPFNERIEPGEEWRG